MEIILKQDVENLGLENDLLKVKNGYGRNYLIPQGYAMLANDSNRKVHAERLKQQGIKENKLLAEIETVVKKLQATPVRVGAKISQSGKIFGSVTTIQIADAIKKQLEVDINRKNIEILEEMKMVGTFPVAINLHKDHKIEIKLEVIED
jgi:large subunit ribosomal protein L9